MNRNDLMPFCSKDPLREPLQAPYTRGAWTYATDGRIVIRVPAMPDVPDNPKAPDQGPMVFDANPPTGGEWLPLPKPPTDMPDPDDRMCPECRGNAKVPWHYKDRNGESHSRLHACPVCDGEGIMNYRTAIPMPWAGLWLNAWNVYELAKLPRVELQPAGIGAGKPVCLCIRFDGGEGRVMTMEVPAHDRR